MAVDPFFGSVLAAGTNLLGGLIGGGAKEAANKQQEAQFDYNARQQMAFATRGLTWRAEDAMEAYKRTGIHPLAMLGVSGPTYSPTFTAFDSSNPVGEGVARAGQDISRSINATADRELRGAALKLQEAALNTSAERGQLENELLKTRIASERMRLAQQSGPAMPKPGASETDINFPGVEKQIIPDVTVVRTPRGGYVVVPGKEVQSRMEEMFGLGPEWFSRNRAWLATPEAREWVQKFLPKPPSNQEWRYHVPTGEWLPSYIDYPDRHMFPDVGRRVANRVRDLGL